MKRIGDVLPSDEALSTMRERGGDWYAYENHDLGHRDLGALQFLRCGPGCTYLLPPLRLPDTPTAINWRYVLAGKVDLDTGEVVNA